MTHHKKLFTGNYFSRGLRVKPSLIPEDSDWNCKFCLKQIQNPKISYENKTESACQLLTLTPMLCTLPCGIRGLVLTQFEVNLALFLATVSDFSWSGAFTVAHNIHNPIQINCGGKAFQANFLPIPFYRFHLSLCSEAKKILLYYQLCLNSRTIFKSLPVIFFFFALWGNLYFTVREENQKKEANLIYPTLYE